MLIQVRDNVKAKRPSSILSFFPSSSYIIVFILKSVLELDMLSSYDFVGNDILVWDIAMSK